MRYAFKPVYSLQHTDEPLQIETVKQYYPSEDVVILDKTPRLRFSEGIQMLKDSGWKEDDGSELSETDDLSTRAEQRLGQLVKEKYGADFYIIDKFPLEVRPFYTMPDPEDNVSASSMPYFYILTGCMYSGGRTHTTSSSVARRSSLVASVSTWRHFWRSVCGRTASTRNRCRSTSTDSDGAALR